MELQISNVNGLYSSPEIVHVMEIGDTIQMVYIETSMVQLSIYPPIPPERRTFKVVYSCIDGKWNKSERIYGKIIPALRESYIFEI